MKRWMVLVAVLALTASAVLALPVTASAEEEAATGSVRLEGAGLLVAQGSGLAVLDGRMNFHGTAHSGVLFIKDRAGDAVIQVDGYGHKLELPGGGVIYFGFHGEAHIVGSDLKVAIFGEQIRIRVVGEGTAFLQGHGWYWVRGHPLRPWTEEGVSLEVEP